MKKLLVITALAGLAATARAQVGPIMVPKEKGEALLPWGLECPNSFECEERQSPGRLPVEAGCRHKTAKKEWWYRGLFDGLYYPESTAKLIKFTGSTVKGSEPALKSDVLPGLNVAWFYRKRKNDKKRIRKVAKSGECVKIPRTQKDKFRKYETFEIHHDEPIVAPYTKGPFTASICAVYPKFTPAKGNDKASCGGKRIRTFKRGEKVGIAKAAHGIVCW